MRIQAFADASFHKEDKASYGIVIRPENDKPLEFSGLIPENIPNNNVAELYAVYMAVRFVMEHWPECHLLEIWNDSRTVIALFNKRNLLNRGSHYYSKNIMNEIDKLLRGKYITFLPNYMRIIRRRKCRTKPPKAIELISNMLRRCDRLAEKVFSPKRKRVA